MLKKIQLKKLDSETTKIERKVKKAVKKLWLLSIFLGFFLAVVFFFYSFYKISLWYDENRVVFQQPVIVKIQPPFRIEKREKPQEKKQEKPKAREIRKQTLPLSEKEIVLSQKHGEILWKIYGLETSWGKNDYCRKNGLGFGGFGVMDGSKVVCYPTFQKAVERAEFWLTKNGVDEDLATALCLWNTGIKQTNCKYFQNFLNL